MTHPSQLPHVPPVPTAPAPSEATVATAKKLVRVRSFTKSVFEKVGVPVAIGAVTGLVVTRAARNSQGAEELDSVSTTDE